MSRWVDQEIIVDLAEEADQLRRENVRQNEVIQAYHQTARSLVHVMKLAEGPTDD